MNATNINKRPRVVWLKCARSIDGYYELSNRPGVQDRLDVNFNELIDRLNVLRRQQAIASKRGWNAAEQLVDQDLRRQLSRIRDNAMLELTKSQSVSRFQIDPSELFRDLLALNEEFAGAEFDAKTKRLSVVTKDITLEDFRFGAFKIVLHLETLSTSTSARAFTKSLPWIQTPPLQTMTLTIRTFRTVDSAKVMPSR